MLNKNRISIVLGLVAVVIMLALPSCKSHPTDSLVWGKSTYYKDFLWKKYVPDTLYRTLRFDFNEDAQAYLERPLRLGVYYREGLGLVRVLENEMQLIVDGVEVPGNEIVVPPTTREMRVGIVFRPEAANKLHFWYLKPIDDAGLESINDRATNEMGDDAIYELRVYKNKVMNPLAAALLAILITIIVALILWLCLLKQMFFPVFKIQSVYLTDPVPYLRTLRVKGCRQLIMTDKPQKQNWLNKFFTGEIRYEINDLWTSQVLFLPEKKNVIRIRCDRNIYMIDTNLIRTNDEYKLKNIDTKNITKLRIS